MSYHQRYSKDRVHDEIRDALIAVGCEVEEFHDAARKGVPDLHVCVRWNVAGLTGARLYWLECKSPEAVFCKDGTPRKTVISNPKTAAAQAKWATRFPVYRVTSVQEALAIVRCTE